MAAKQNPHFLPAQPPANARCQRIDFTKTNPPLPEYKNYVAAVIDNALTEDECKELLRLAEATTFNERDPTATPAWDRAMVNAGGGVQVLAADTRNCGRIIFDTPVIAEKLLNRLMPFLQELGIDRIENQPMMVGLRGRGKTYRMTRLNERLRFLKYVGGEYFRPHWDVQYETPDRRERSYYTVHLYLNGDGDQDLRELLREQKSVERGHGAINPDTQAPLLGGATSFLRDIEHEEKTDSRVRIFPKTGSVLVFQQYNLLHGGDAVFRGTKYTLRTDIMYEEVQKS